MSDERSRIVALDKRHVWHPYTPMDEYRAHVDPLVVAHAEGSWLFDLDGRRYLDGNASWWVCCLGHNHPRLVAALKRQADTLCHSSLAGATHEGAAALAQELCQVAPRGLEHVFFSDDGSTAVEVAMKLALQYWAQNGRPSRRRFVALEGAFHGETLGVTALGGVEIFRRPFAGALLDCVHVPSPAEDSAYERAFDALERIVRKESEEIAAVVLEPIIQGASGMRMYDPAYLRAVRGLCDACDVFLVADEVFTGYGRTGSMWACDQADLSPDLLCTAKGFCGGMLPMAATLTTSRIFEGFLGAPERAFYYGHSFCGNPLGAAVAREVLRIYAEEKVLEGARTRALRIAKAFAEMADLPGVVRTRALGMVGALDLGGPSGYLAGGGWRVYEEARRRGAYLRPLGNVIYVAPSLVIPDEDLALLLSIVQESVAAGGDTMKRSPNASAWVAALCFATLGFAVTGPPDTGAFAAEPAPQTLSGFRLVPLLVDAGLVRAGGPGRDQIKAVDDPQFVVPEKATWVLGDTPVIGIELEGQARAYPVHLMERHQLVNDLLAGVPITVSYDPLAGTPRGFRRSVAGKTLHFGVSGLVYNACSLMYDRETESLWSQFTGQAISGALAGTRLERIPVRQEPRDLWLGRAPSSTVLVRPNPKAIDYRYSPYTGYWLQNEISFPVAAKDPRFHAKELVLGVAKGGKTRAYLGSLLTAAGGRVTDEFQGKTIRILYDSEGAFMQWEAPKEVEVTEAYWFAWKAFHPDTEIWNAPPEKPKP